MRSQIASEENSTVLWGYVIVGLSALWFISMMFLLVGTKFLPVTGNPLLDFLRGDYYYPLLVPMTVTVTLVGVYLNWLAMKFFRHN